MARTRLHAGLAAGAAVAGLLSAPTARAADHPAAAHRDLCPRGGVVCVWVQGPVGQGPVQMFTTNTWNIDLPVRGAANYTSDPWCFYSQPNYANLHWEVQPGRYTSDMQWTGARSFKRGRC